MKAPKRKAKPRVAGAPLPAEVPEDVRSELGLEALAPVSAAPPKVPVEQIPEDVLAERDAEARAAHQAATDADLRPVALDDDSEY